MTNKRIIRDTTNSIVSALVDSNEFKIKYELQKIAPALVEMSYLGLLGRPADPEGLRAYVNLVNRTGTLKDVLRSMIESDEFHVKYRTRETPDHDSRRGADECIVFIHIEKTAGTSLQGMLIDAFGQESVYHEHGDTLYWRSPAELSEYSVFAGHFNHDSLAYIPHKNIKLITFVREPKERLVSLYSFWKAHNRDAPSFVSGMALANEYDIGDFFTHEEVVGQHGVWNHMTWCIMGQRQWLDWKRLLEETTGDERVNHIKKIRQAIKERLREFSFIGLQNDFDRSCALLFKLIGRELPAIRQEHSVKALANLHPYFKLTEKPEITTSVNRVLASLTELDAIVYSEAKKLVRTFETHHGVHLL